MRRISLFILAAALVAPLAAEVSAQSAASGDDAVVLRGWGLPEDAVVTSVTNIRRNAVARYFEPGADTTAQPLRTLEIFTLRADSVRTTLLAVEDGQPQRLDHFILISDVLEEVHENDEVLEQGRRPNPLSGTRFTSERQPGAGWHREFIRPEEPTAEQLAALREPLSFSTPQYPERPVRPGEEWAVDRSAIEELYGRLVEGRPHRLTYRLDSTGTYMGRPAAYLSYGLEATIDHGDGLVMQMNEVGRVIRVLDRYVDLLTQRQGSFRTERAGVFEDGQPYLSILQGGIRGQEQLFLTVPAGAAARGTPPAGSQ